MAGNVWARRTLLKAVAAAAGSGVFALDNGVASGASAPADLVLQITAAPGTASIRRGGPTPVPRYTGAVLRGCAAARTRCDHRVDILARRSNFVVASGCALYSITD